MKLAKILAEEIINEGKEVIGVFGGSYKPVTKGHFEVIKKAIDQNPHINKFIIYVGSGVRNGITQAESLLIWDIYKKYLDANIEIIPTSSPISAIYKFAKENPDKNIKWIIGTREEREEDIIDLTKRTTQTHKYPNIEVLNIQTPSSLSQSGTKAREALNKSKEEFFKYIPSELSDEDKEEVYNISSQKIMESQQKESSFMGRLGLKWDKFLNSLKSEKEETKEAFDLLLQHYRGDIELTDQQKKQIGDQLKDVLKMVGFVGILALPGGTIFLMLINFLKLNGFIIPSSFKKEEKIEESKQVGTLYHFTSYPSFIKIENQNQLKPSMWKTIITNKEGKKEFKQNYAISFTRDKNFNKRAYSIGGIEVALVIDGDKLSNKFKLTPTAEKDFPKAESENFEAEERINFNNSEGIKNIKDYIIGYNFYLDKIINDPISLDEDPELYKLRNFYLFDPKSKFFLNKKEISKQEAKKYLDEIFESELIGENIQKIDPVSLLKEIAEYCCAQLNISMPKITLLNKLDFTQENNSFGCYIPSDHEIKVVIKGRNLSDSGRTLSHEMKHHHQNLEKRLTVNAGEDGDIFENEANQFSGEIMRYFNRKYPWILTTFVK